MKKIIFDLKELVASPVGTKETFKIKSEIASPDKENIAIKSPILGKGIFTNLDKHLLADFDLATTIELSCARCGEKFTKKIDLKIKKTYKLNQLNQNQEIDILPDINEEIILSVPTKPLCKKECLGLCPICGQNLNIKKCSCRIETKSKPFANLKEILERK